MVRNKYTVDLSTISATLGSDLVRRRAFVSAADLVRSANSLGALDKVGALVGAHKAAFEHLDAIGKTVAMFREQQRFAEQFERFSKAATLFDDALASAKWMTEVQKSARLLTDSHPAFLGRLDEEFARWDSVLRGPLAASSQSALAQAGLSWGAGVGVLVDRLASSGLLQTNELVAERLLQPAAQYTDFVKATKARIKRAEGGDRVDAASTVRRLEASLHFTEGQFIDATNLLADILTPDTEPAGPPSSTRPLGGPKRQQAEFLQAQGDNDVASVAAHSATAALATTSREVLRFVAQCNELRSVAGQEVVFTPTTRILEVFADFPWLVAVDRRSFGDVLDCLYFLLYEGAGKDNLRFTKKHGGPLEDSDCDVIWRIKHLRNKWLRHDVEHGGAGAIRKSYEQLAGHLRALGLNGPPRTAQQFLLLQRALLAEVLVFLRTLHARMEGGAT